MTDRDELMGMDFDRPYDPFPTPAVSPEDSAIRVNGIIRLMCVALFLVIIIALIFFGIVTHKDAAETSKAPATIQHLRD